MYIIRLDGAPIVHYLRQESWLEHLSRVATMQTVSRGGRLVDDVSFDRFAKLFLPLKITFKFGNFGF